MFIELSGIIKTRYLFGEKRQERQPHQNLPRLKYGPRVL